MDPLRVRVSVKPIGAATGYAADFAVDVLGMNLIAPAFELARVGIEPVGRSAFAEMEILGQRTVSRAIFGPDDTELIIGNLLFQSVGFVIDPDTQEIKRRP